jgi:hypothetical protein
MPKRVLTTAVAFVAVLASFLSLSAAAPAAAAGGVGRTVAVCFAPRGNPDLEHTLHVPRSAVPYLVRATASYQGPCAQYGESARRGNGALTAYSQSEHGVPHAVGLVFDASTLDGLPDDPPNEGRWCHDRDGDGTEDRMTECSGGYENALHLSDAFRRTVDTPFTYLLVNWNPTGHVPPEVYDLPHFDVHFYVNDNSERLAIRPGPCPMLVNCADYRLGKDLPAPRYRHPDYVDVDALEPAMGNHLVDPTGPEFNGERFTHAFVYGTWDDDVTFYEPMVTRQWYRGLVDGTRDDACFPLKLPRAWERSGWYPTRYCLRYRENRDELITSLEGFVYRHAS